MHAGHGAVDQKRLKFILWILIDIKHIAVRVGGLLPANVLESRGHGSDRSRLVHPVEPVASENPSLMSIHREMGDIHAVDDLDDRPCWIGDRIEIREVKMIAVDLVVRVVVDDDGIIGGDENIRNSMRIATLEVKADALLGLPVRPIVNIQVLESEDALIDRLDGDLRDG